MTYGLRALTGNDGGGASPPPAADDIADDRQRKRYSERKQGGGRVVELCTICQHVKSQLAAAVAMQLDG
jgi:hypothetical protein